MSCHTLLFMESRFMEKFSDIQTRNELADFLQIPRSKLTYLLYIVGTQNCYTTFTIPKKSGGERIICSPCEELKSVQKRLAVALWEHLKSVRTEKGIQPNISHAFEEKRSIITNAAIHRNKRFVWNLDLENFFPSFHFGRVQGYFEKNRDFLLPKEVATTIAQIACYKGCLPQGAPTSPVITNLICQILDMRLLKIAKQYHLDYTRYADDLTFSTNDHAFLEKHEAFCEEVMTELQRSGFTVNQKKTRLQFRDSRQEVTGLTVNKKVNVKRDYYKKTKAMAYRLYTEGGFEIDGVPASVSQLEGRFSFINQLDHYNNKLDGEKHNCYHLNGREKQYQAFLFYKYFFANEKPLVVAEGHTDPLYLKGALKYFYKEYPALITRDSDGNFDFKCSFFRRSKRWKYFFDLSMDGADTIKNLYRYFVHGQNTPNYLEDFRRLSGAGQKNPVIFLYDNETVSDRPLKKFLSSSKLAPVDKDTFRQDSHILLVPDSKLFLLTIPLAHGQKECEIEDLFTQETLDTEIDGRHFSRNDKYDSAKFYGKDVFAKYCLANYRKIDFSGFKPLLNLLSEIVQAH